MRVTEGDSSGRLTESGLETDDAELFFLSSMRRGVCSVVVISSVTPVVNMDGLGGWAAVGEGGTVSGGDTNASLRFNENSTICVYRYMKIQSTRGISLNRFHLR